MSAFTRDGALRIAAYRTNLVLVSLGAFLFSSWTPADGSLEQATLGRAIVPSTLPTTGTVEFPNASAITVAFRRAAAQPAPPDPLEQYPAYLRSAQEGDARSASIVGTVLTVCARIRGVPFPTEDSNLLRPRGKLPDNAFDNVALRDFCAQRTSEEIAAGLAWLEKAALGGDLEAMQRLERLYRTGSDKQVDVLNAIWEQGSIMALYKLASAYRFRRAQAGADSQDAIKALASTWLYVQLNESAFRLHSTHSDFLDALHKDLARQLQETNPSTHADAIALARTMLSQNARCCVIP